MRALENFLGEFASNCLEDVPNEHKADIAICWCGIGEMMIQVMTQKCFNQLRLSAVCYIDDAWRFLLVVEWWEDTGWK